MTDERDNEVTERRFNEITPMFDGLMPNQIIDILASLVGHFTAAFEHDGIYPEDYRDWAACFEDSIAQATEFMRQRFAALQDEPVFLSPKEFERKRRRQKRRG